MIVRLEPLKILAWGIVLGMIVLAMGCGHRSSHSSQAHSKKLQKARMMAQQPVSSDLITSNRSSGGDGYFPDASETLSRLLDEEELIHEDAGFGNDESIGGAPNDYWVNRTRAEQFTEQSGLEDVHFAFNSVQLTEQAKAIFDGQCRMA